MVPTVNAVEVDNLYVGKILVTDRTQQTRVKAHRWAIEQVIVKVTGNRDILTNDTIKREVRLRTANYIKSFTFEVDEQERTFLVDEFDQQKIDGLLRSVGASIWGQRRPLTLVWLVIEEGLSRQIIDTSNAPQISELLLQASDNRGLPITLPQSGVEYGLFSSDIWAKFDHIVAPASRVLDVDHYVMARMYVGQNEGVENWHLDFQLMDGRTILSTEKFVGEQFEVVRSFVDAMADYFASQYSIKSEVFGQKNIVMTIDNVHNVIDIVEVERYLKNLPPVAAVELKHVAEQQAQFNLDLSGQALDVVKALDLLDEFTRIEKVVSNQQPQLSVEEQLEQLRQSYLSGETAQKVENPLSVLRYKWGR